MTTRRKKGEIQPFLLLTKNIKYIKIELFEKIELSHRD